MTFQTEKLSYIDNKNSIEQNIALISQLNAADLLTVWKQYAANELKTLETNKASQFCELSKQVVAQFRRTKEDNQTDPLLLFWIPLVANALQFQSLKYALDGLHDLFAQDETVLPAIFSSLSSLTNRTIQYHIIEYTLNYLQKNSIINNPTYIHKLVDHFSYQDNPKNRLIVKHMLHLLDSIDPDNEPQGKENTMHLFIAVNNLFSLMRFLPHRSNFTDFVFYSFIPFKETELIAKSLAHNYPDTSIHSLWTECSEQRRLKNVLQEIVEDVEGKQTDPLHKKRKI